MQTDSVPFVKFTPGYIVQYAQRQSHVRTEKRQAIAEANLTRGVFTGQLSAKTKTKVVCLLSNWYLAAGVHNKQIPKGSKEKRTFFTFVTLTLSAKQMHSDNVIKRCLLNAFLIKLCRETGVVNWFWRAEKQKNGNIHFHLILDSFVKASVLQGLWNSSQAKLGYIKRFAAVYGHNNPNSTDIKKVSNSKAAMSYISKYVKKEEGNGKVSGRLWGSTDAVKCFVSMPLEATAATNSAVESFALAPRSRVINREFCTVVICDVYNNAQRIASEVWEIIEKSLLKSYRFAYNIAETVENVVETVVAAVPKRVTKYHQMSINMY